MNKALLTVLPIFLGALLSCKQKAPEADTGGRLTPKEEINQVETITLKRTVFPRELLSNGRLRANRRASLSFSTSGPIAAVHVRNGQRVSAGTLLATLDRPDLQLALEAAEISQAQAEIKLFDLLAGMGFSARDTSSVPEAQLQSAKIQSGFSAAQNALKRAKYNLQGTYLLAPFAGRVSDVTAQAYSQAGTEPFCTLLDDSSFIVDFTVMESELSFLSEALPVQITPFADELSSFKGVVSGINPSVDNNGQIRVSARIPGNKNLLDGMNVRISVEKLIPDQLVVPRSAIVIRDNMDVLFTYSEDGKSHWIYVNILHSNGTSHAVQANPDRLGELKEGDQVIISGNLNLADGSMVSLKR